MDDLDLFSNPYVSQERKGGTESGETILIDHGEKGAVIYFEGSGEIAHSCSFAIAIALAIILSMFIILSMSVIIFIRITLVAVGDDDDLVALLNQAGGEGIYVHFDPTQFRVEEIGY
mmetsp:Transcript_20867/g.30735  ORF Transcript_20867/g.30735 Transcript_20867/m.30735 type:complete len:117 (+) Transcript_20867:1438-1788(+)